MIGALPKSLLIDGIEYDIRSDFRDVLKIVVAFSDPELGDGEKVYICLRILYPGFDDMPQEQYEAAFRAAIEFIDNGQKDDGRPSPRVMDWEQDETLVFPAINKVAGYETRSCDYLHWWTFIGYYMEISEGVYSSVLNLRMKRAKGKKLEKWEQEYWRSNKRICVLKPKLTEAEKEARDKLNALLD
ncbi:MAG: bacteriophage Gp15 family protein [Lachnospiraceae bacterium]|nr:bacteriophage Gp15 family protein [Lachnospiraceae bacterium]